MTIQEERSDALGHEREPLINADNVEAASGSPRDEKKSVLKMVKDKAKDKVKKLGSKLKSRGHGGGDDDGKKQEMIDDSVPGGELEDEEEVPAADTNASDSSQARNLDVPLDEFALLKQRESNEKKDNQAKEGKRDDLTEGLPSQAIAEQQEPAEALQALPTNYHYQNDGSEGDGGDKITNEIEDEESVNKTTTDDHTESEQNLPLQLKPSSEGYSQQSRMDGSIFTSDGDKGSSDALNLSPENVQALSSSNLYTGEPDVNSDEKKPDIKTTEREADIPAMGPKRDDDGTAGEYSTASDDQKRDREENTPLDSKELRGTDQVTGERGQVPAQIPYHQVVDEKGGSEILAQGSSGSKPEAQQSVNEQQEILKAEEHDVTGDHASGDPEEQGEIPAQTPFHSKAEEDEVNIDQQVDVPSEDGKVASACPMAEEHQAVDDKQEGEVPAQAPYHSKEEEKQVAANQQEPVEYLSKAADEQGEISTQIPDHSNSEEKEAAEEHQGEIPAQVPYHSQSDEQQADSKPVDTNEIGGFIKDESKISTGGKTETAPGDEAENDAKSTLLSPTKEQSNPNNNGEVKAEDKPDDIVDIERNANKSKDEIVDQDESFKNNETSNAAGPSGLFGQFATKLGYTSK